MILGQVQLKILHSSVFIIAIIFLFASFSHQRTWVSFHWSLRDSKFPHLTRTFLSILVDLNNAVVWKVLVRPTTSNSSSSHY